MRQKLISPKPLRRSKTSDKQIAAPEKLLKKTLSCADMLGTFVHTLACTNDFFRMSVHTLACRNAPSMSCKVLVVLAPGGSLVKNFHLTLAPMSKLVCFFCRGHAHQSASVCRVDSRKRSIARLRAILISAARRPIMNALGNVAMISCLARCFSRSWMAPLLCVAS